MPATEQECLDLIQRIEPLFPRATNGYDVFPDDDGHSIYMVCNESPTDEMKAELERMLPSSWKTEWLFFEHRRWRCRIFSV